MSLDGTKSFVIEEPGLREGDLTPAMIARETSPKKTWFLQRSDRPNAEIIAVDGKAASEMIYNPQKVLVNYKWRVVEWSIIGVSDGKTYQKTIKESRAKADQVSQEIMALQKEQDRYRKTEEKMVFDDLVDPDDTTPETAEPRRRLAKVREIIARYDQKLNEKEAEFRLLTKDISKLAFQKELEVARGHIEMPENHNIITPGATPQQRKRILRSLDDQAGI